MALVPHESYLDIKKYFLDIRKLNVFYLVSDVELLFAGKH